MDSSSKDVDKSVVKKSKTSCVPRDYEEPDYRTDFWNIINKFPIDNINEFNKFLEELEDPNSNMRLKVDNLLRSLGGKGPHSHVRNMLDKIMTRRLAEKYSYHGSRGNKLAFKNLEIYKLIEVTPDLKYTKSELKDTVQGWLMAANQIKNPEVSKNRDKKVQIKPELKNIKVADWSIDKFPIDSVEEFEELSSELTEFIIYAKVEHMLRCVEADDMHFYVRNMLDRIMTRNVAKHYSFHGSRGKKKIFIDHKIYEIFIKIVISPKYTLHDLDETIKAWLQQANRVSYLNPQKNPKEDDNVEQQDVTDSSSATQDEIEADQDD